MGLLRCASQLLLLAFKALLTTDVLCGGIWVGASGWECGKAIDLHVSNCACLFKCHGLRNGDLARHNAPFLFLGTVVSPKEGTFPENMLFQDLLIPEHSESHRDTPARFQSQGLWREGTVGVPLPVLLQLTAQGFPCFILQTSKMGFSSLHPSVLW